jgi:hypothetical protein
MKKILPLMFVAVVMIFAVAQTTEAIAPTSYPNGDYVEFWANYEFDGYDSLVVTYANDGNAYATALDVSGLPDPFYYQMYLSTYSGYLYCSEDGYVWFLCP